ncbi:PucR family transcriptional regulator [Adlercreutzia aquisgranensis]|uniref:PucR family transcriptional regulator n=1 Tax=Adlercreutzia aquisgranensis TaxID=2941323 RepID=UPI00203E3DCC|nr:PucR family transcriptional regulator [Adlercreutzia aquisgranensis]
MITVRNVLELPVFDNVRLAAPCERYLDRPVINCGTLEGEPFFHDYDMFVPGEFIFTSLGFAQIHPELAEEAMLALIERDVAALAIKPYAIKDLPDTVRQASTRRGVPVFFYDGRYMERILASAMALIDSDAADSGRSQLIDQLLAPSDERQVGSLIYQISGLNGATLQCLAIRPPMRDLALLRALWGSVRQTLDDYAARFEEVGGAFVCIYDDMILGFVAFKRPPQSVITISEANLAKYVVQAGPMCCGLSQELPLGEGDLAIRQALAALQTACARQESTVRFTSLRYDAFRAAARTDRMFSRTASLVAALLQEYDESHSTLLLPTAKAFARAHGDVRATAEVLFQHPNTVRYRLGRIKDVLGMPEATDRQVAELLSFMVLAQD